MASPKKHPFNPVAPVFGKIPELKETEGLLENVEPSAGFASEFLNCPVNVNHAKAAFIHVRANGKGKPLFKTEAEFLSKLAHIIHGVPRIYPRRAASAGLTAVF